MYLIDIDDKDFDNEVIEHSKKELVVVDFWAEWCAPCKALIPQLELIAKNEFLNKIRICKINIDKNYDSPLKYGVRSIPTVMIFKNGKKISQVIGSDISEITLQINNILYKGVDI